MRSLRLPKVFRRPAGRATTAMLSTAGLLSAFAVAAGVGYTASRPLLGDGCAFLGKGHTVAQVCGETGRSDAEIAQQLATGTEELQAVRLPDGRLAIVNQSTGTLSYFDTATLAPTSPPVTQPEAAGKLEPVATATDGYLVDQSRNVVEKIGAPDQPAPERITIPDGITATVPSGDSLWVMTNKAEVVEVIDGKVHGTVRLGVAPAGITVADGHPVVVAEDGNAYAVDGAKPRLLGNVGLTGRKLLVGSWRGPGRYVVAVDRESGRVGILDPRTGQQRGVQLKFTAGRTDLDAPVALGDWIYVPDRSEPGLWRIDATKGVADGKPLEVPGQPGPFKVTVENGHVWANSQYDRRVLVVDANGHHRYADKGPRPELGDTEGGTGQGTTGGTGQPAPPESPLPAGPPANTPGPMVTIPAFPARTPYKMACEELKKLKLICRTVAGGDVAGLRTGDVVSTDPGAGTQVPEGSRVVVRYAGPLKTPSVVGIWHEDACNQIKAAKLTCAPSIDPSPALGPNSLGVVSDQSPGPQEQLAKGKPVSYTYPDSIALPNLVNQSWSAACDQIRRLYRMKCEAAPGDPPPAGKQVGQVYAQNPSAPYVAKMGATVTLRYYRGTSNLPSVVGQNIHAACAQLRGLGFGCTPQEGASAWGTGHPVEAVYQQSPAGNGQEVAVGTPIVLTYYSPNQDLPNYAGVNSDAACADINARGFQCMRVTHPYRTTNVVEAQDRGAGRHPLGSAVTIAYNPWPLIDWWIVPYGGGWRMQAGSGEHRIGFAYPPNATFTSGGQMVYQYRCPSGEGRVCRGYGHSVFYSRIVPPGTGYVDPDFDGKAFTVFAACTGAPGQRKVWRTWTIDANRRFFYSLVHSDGTPGGVSDSEALGCIWW